MRDLWIVFDGPPAPESGRFIEVEDGSRKSVSATGVSWVKSDDGFWRLGPFCTDPDIPCGHLAKKGMAPPIPGGVARVFFCIDCGERFEVLYEKDGAIAWRSLDAEVSDGG